MKELTFMQDWICEIFHTTRIFSRLRRLFGPLNHFDLTNFLPECAQTLPALWSIKTLCSDEIFHHNVLKTSPTLWSLIWRVISPIWWDFLMLLDVKIASNFAVIWVIFQHTVCCNLLDAELPAPQVLTTIEASILLLQKEENFVSLNLGRPFVLMYVRG